MPPYSAPPTLEQLRALLDSVRHAGATRDPNGARTTFAFTVDNETLENLGVGFYADAGTLVAALLEAIDRLCYIDTCVGDYADADKKGPTAADIQAFLANELKHVPPTYDLASNMQRRMFNAALQKMVELAVWRAAVDAKRFQNQREAERKRRAEEKVRREEARQRQEEFTRQAREQRQREREEAERKESQAGADRGGFGPFGGGGFGGGSNSNRASPPPGGTSFEDLFRQAFEAGGGPGLGDTPFGQAYEEMWRRERGGRSWYEQTWDPAGGPRAKQQEQPKEKAKPKARNKARAPWYEVLKVSASADKQTIQKAYRQLAAKYHPDRCKDADAVEKMSDINTARDEGLAT